MKKVIAMTFLAGAAVFIFQRCATDLSTKNTGSTTTLSSTLTAVAQTSGQLASGTTFTISGAASVDTTTITSPGPGGPGHGGEQHHPGMCIPLNGTSLLAPTDELLAIVDAESAGDLRGIHMHTESGATVTNYDSLGNVLRRTASALTGQGCSFSGGQFPITDSLLARIAKTVIDYGSGVTDKYDTITIKRAGMITITRAKSGSTITETIVFTGYSVNGISIEGTKTRTNTVTKSGSTETGVYTTHVANGKITFTDGSVAVWVSDKQRNSTITRSTDGIPLSGEVTTDGTSSVTLSDGTVVYSNKITKTITENIACGNAHHGPVSGTVETIYRTNTISIDFGDGSCSNTTITITVNGVTTTKTVA